jgi:hypothetical protein
VETDTARHGLGDFQERYAIPRPSLVGRVAFGTAVVVVLVGAVGGGWWGVAITAALGALLAAGLAYRTRVGASTA